VGRYDLKAPSEKGFIESIVETFIVHPDWNPNDERYDGDITLAIMTATIEFTELIRPLCIWPQTNSHDDLIGKNGLIAGWGIDEKGTTSDRPMFLSLPVVRDIDCLWSNNVFTKITSNSTFCVGDKSGASPCQGTCHFIITQRYANDMIIIISRRLGRRFRVQAWKSLLFARSSVGWCDNGRFNLRQTRVCGLYGRGALQQLDQRAHSFLRIIL
jgi:hypothetical protein